MNHLYEITDQLGWWAILIFVVLATYFWRGLGVVLAGHVSQDGEVFRWLSCVTYALVGSLTIKLIFYPTGLLAEVPMAYRIFVCIVCLVHRIYFNAKLTHDLIIGSLMMAIYGLFMQYL
jgi:branched-subunit amino acid transport protein